MPKKPIQTRVNIQIDIFKQLFLKNFLLNFFNIKYTKLYCEKMWHFKLLGDYSLSKSACMAKNEVEQFSKDLHNLSPFIASQSELHDKIKKCKI